MNKRVRKITMLSIVTTILAILSPISIYISVIPFNLALFIIFIISSIFTLKDTIIIIGLYIILGLIGIPVFAGYIGGIGALTGVTGGFIIGYIPCAIIINLIQKLNKNNYFISAISMVIGLTICYLCGVIFFVILTSSSVIYTLSVLVLPFIIIDVLKIIIACIISYSLKKNTKIMDSIN